MTQAHQLLQADVKTEVNSVKTENGELGHPEPFAGGGDERSAVSRPSCLTAANLSAANLSAANISAANLSAANLSAANLSAAHFAAARHDASVASLAAPSAAAETSGGPLGGPGAQAAACELNEALALGGGGDSPLRGRRGAMRRPSSDRASPDRFSLASSRGFSDDILSSIPVEMLDEFLMMDP